MKKKIYTMKEIKKIVIEHNIMSIPKYQLPVYNCTRVFDGYGNSKSERQLSRENKKLTKTINSKRHL